MTITRALVELKMLDKKINQAINEILVVECQNNTRDTTLISQIKITDFVKNAKADFQSLNDLIERRSKIKSLVIKTNALTKVNINNKEMSIAEAIETKYSIEYKKTLLSVIQRQYHTSLNKMEQSNTKLDKDIKEMMIANFGKDSKNIKTEEFETIEKAFRNKNIVSLIDPIKIGEIIKQLENEINTFEAEIDFVLSEINAKTEIDID